MVAGTRGGVMVGDCGVLFFGLCKGLDWEVHFLFRELGLFCGFKVNRVVD